MTDTLTPDQVLKNAEGKFSNVLVIGILKDNKTLDISTNQPSYMFVNYMLNRTNFQVNLMEHNQISDAITQERMAAESNVAEAVVQNIQTEVKEKRRGRPRKG